MIVLVTGGVGVGKTTALKKALEIFRSRALPEAGVAGYLSERVAEGGETQGYDLLDLDTGARRPLLRKGDGDGQRVGPYRLVPDGLDEAAKAIGRAGSGDLLVVDELGPLELEGRGVWPALEGDALDPARRLIVVVRESLLAGFEAKLGRVPVRVVRFRRQAGAEALAGEIEASLRDAARVG